MKSLLLSLSLTCLAPNAWALEHGPVETRIGTLDFENGYPNQESVQKWNKNLQGHSFYARPSIGLGTNRPTDGSIEFGYKIVGWQLIPVYLRSLFTSSTMRTLKNASNHEKPRL